MKRSRHFLIYLMNFLRIHNAEFFHFLMCTGNEVIGVDGKAGKKTFICVVWEWLLYGNDYTIIPRQIDKMNNPQYALK